jgi:hypothetical protein
VKDFQTPAEQIYEIWQDVMRKAYNNPKLELNETYLRKFKKEAAEIELTKLPIWALRKSAPDSLQQMKEGTFQLKFKKWKKKALELAIRDERSDIETRPDGTTWVIPGSPTDIGRKTIGSIQNYEDKS